MPFFFSLFFQAGNLDAAIESLLNVEKQMRLAGDVAGTKNAVIEIVKLCYEARAWKTLNDQIVLLSKRRGQLKQVKLFSAISCRIFIWVLCKIVTEPAFDSRSCYLVVVFNTIELDYVIIAL